MLTLALLAGCATTSGDKGAEWKLSGHSSPYAFYRSVGYSLLRVKDFRKAVPVIIRLKRRAPKKAEPRYMMARAMLGLELPARARQELKQALTLERAHAPSRSLQGVLLDRLGHHQQAEQAHRKALALERDNPAYHNNLGFCLFMQGRHMAAVAAYAKALSKDPNLPRTHNNIGFAYARAGLAEMARKHFTLAGDAAQVLNNLGLAHEERGDLVRAACYDSSGNVAVDPSTNECTGACNLARVEDEIKVQNGNLMNKGKKNFCPVLQDILRRGSKTAAPKPFVVRVPVLQSTDDACNASQFSSFKTIEGFATMEILGVKCGKPDPGVFVPGTPCTPPNSDKYVMAKLRCDLSSDRGAGGGYFGTSAKRMRLVR